MVSYRGGGVMIDCGLDWLGNLSGCIPVRSFSRTRIPITRGACEKARVVRCIRPQETWRELRYYPVKDRRLIKERTPTKICGITFEAFPVEHSILAPAVGYRVTAGRVCIFYVPDLIFIHDRAAALKDVQVYIGDGATVTRSFIRRRGKALIGHSPVRTQLTWCEKEGVPKAIITHCGSEIVNGDEHKLSAKLRAMAAGRGIEVRLAYDGMKLEL
jgi:phosphoribosyl 1,2-cyclic phosphodiesterase